MAYYLAKERDEDVVGAYRRYQDYLRQHRAELPSTAYDLGTAEWYQDPNDHRCPHDAWLESITVAEAATGARGEHRNTNIRIRLLGAYHDGFLEFYYPRVFSYSFVSPSSVRGLGEWLYDEFRVSSAGHLIHEIEWAHPHDKASRWIIETSTVEYQWIPK